MKYKDSLTQQFKISMNGAKGLVSEEQFFKEFVCAFVLMVSYFPNGEYKFGVDLLLDVDGTIQRLRDEVVCVSAPLSGRSKLSTI